MLQAVRPLITRSIRENRIPLLLILMVISLGLRTSAQKWWRHQLLRALIGVRAGRSSIA
jgi:hypothetical protein